MHATKLANDHRGLEPPSDSGAPSAPRVAPSWTHAGRSPDSVARRDSSPVSLTVVAVVLAVVAGFVDAVGYLHVVRVFPANQGGNVAFLGLSIGGTSPVPGRATTARHWATMIRCAGVRPTRPQRASKGRVGRSRSVRRRRSDRPVALLTALAVALVVVGSRDLYVLRSRDRLAVMAALAAVVRLAWPRSRRGIRTVPRVVPLRVDDVHALAPIVRRPASTGSVMTPRLETDTGRLAGRAEVLAFPMRSLTPGPPNSALTGSSAPPGLHPIGSWGLRPSLRSASTPPAAASSERLTDAV